MRAILPSLQIEDGSGGGDGVIKMVTMSDLIIPLFHPNF
jgi:hypothetical protein